MGILTLEQDVIPVTDVSLKNAVVVGYVPWKFRSSILAFPQAWRDCHL